MVGSGARPRDPEDTLPDYDAPLRGMDDLLALFHDAEKPRERWRIGTEAERIAVGRRDGALLPYDGPVSVVAIFERLVADQGWEPERERDGGPIIAYERNGKEMSVRSKGPLWIVYPYDSNPSYKTEAIYSRSIWQLEGIVLKQ